MKIRESDNGAPDEEREALVAMRRFSFESINKIIWGVISILGLTVGFFIVRWFNNIDEKFVSILKESKDYTDTLMQQHVKDMKPYWEGFGDVKKTVAETHDEVERITNFLEFKYGMPEKKIRRLQ